MFTGLFKKEKMTMSQLSKINLGIVTSFNNIKEKAKNVLNTLKESASEEEELVVQVYENERFNRISGWSPNNLLHDDDCKRYLCSAGESNEFPLPPLMQGFEYFGEWIIDYAVENSRNGWIYAASFEDMDNSNIDVLTDSSNLSTSNVRRRRWIRTVKEITGDDANDTNQEISDLDVGADVEFTVDSDEERNTEESDSYTVISNPNNLSGVNTQNIDNDAFSLFNFAKKNGSFDSDTSAFFLRDSGLIAIGKQITLIEAFCRKDEEHAEHEWKKSEKPQLESQIKELEKNCATLNSRIEKEIHVGLEHINMLERDVKAHQEVLESVKKRFYFPNSSIVVGQGGVYAGLDDIWLEHASGHFEVELVPCKDRPQIKVILTSGNISGGEKGVSIRLKAEGFKLAGDKGKGIPKLSMSSIKLTLVLVANILIDYDHKFSKWITNSKNFSIKLISFKGPYGTSKSIMGAILSVITPTLRTQIIKNLPLELGQLLRTLPSPFCIRGDFHVSGVELNLISAPFASTPAVLRMINITRNQVHLFKYLQKSMDRSATSFLDSISDVLAYNRISKRHSRHWETIFVLWQQAAKIYSTKLIDLAHSFADEKCSINSAELNIDFETFICACKLINRKKLNTIFKLEHMDGQASVNQLVRHAHQFLHRIATESVATASAAQKARMMMSLERIQTNYLYGLDAIKLISKNIDFAHVKIAAALHAGLNGVVEMNISDIFAQAPILLDINIQKDKQLGHSSLIPFIVSLKPQESGTVFIEVDQIISDCHMKDDMPKEAAVSYSPSNPRPYSPINPLQMNYKQLVSIVLTLPHFSMIIDNAATFKPGTELLTFKVGPRQKGWMPFGHDTIEKATSKSLAVGEEQGEVENEVSKSPTLIAMGCQIFVQTAPHIKFLAQIPSAEVNINLRNLTKFIASHFTDIAALKSYLELLFGGEFFEEQLIVGQIVLDRISKYILNPGLDLEVNIDGKIVALGNEIMVRLETPQYIVNLHEGLYDTPNRNKNVFHNHFANDVNEKATDNNNAPNLGSIPCVLELKAELNLMDLLDDSLAIENSIKSAIESSLKKVENDGI